MVFGSKTNFDLNLICVIREKIFAHFLCKSDADKSDSVMYTIIMRTLLKHWVDVSDYQRSRLHFKCIYKLWNIALHRLQRGMAQFTSPMQIQSSVQLQSYVTMNQSVSGYQQMSTPGSHINSYHLPSLNNSVSTLAGMSMPFLFYSITPLISLVVYTKYKSLMFLIKLNGFRFGTVLFYFHLYHKLMIAALRFGKVAIWDMFS